MSDPMQKIYEIFIRWYAMPFDSRDPKSITEFCEHFNIKQSDIAQFQRREEFTADLYNAAIAWGKSKVPEMLHILYKKFIESHNPNDMKIYRDLLNMDKGSKKDDDDKESSNGVLRELFSSSNEEDD